VGHRGGPVIAPLDDATALTMRKALAPTYPAPWRGFTDITRVLEQEPAAFRALVDGLLAPHRADPPAAVLAVEACGFVFGAPQPSSTARSRLSRPVVTNHNG
jgi:adenine/guanine phosphoribosyltransferase-like PRPP-binding protein